MGDLTKHFSAHEFACRCGCGKKVIDSQFLQLLEDSREGTFVPFVITSGVRCMSHNKAVGGKEHSAHISGKAVDIECKDSMRRFNLLRALIRDFDRIGIAKDFIHVDNDITKPKEVTWLY
tara:strand:- start:819 stop:1178 length:360 start_codon:yes stop_codon:yes gene_type:complete